jgi:DNA-binding SARP family transcriptional activator
MPRDIGKETAAIRTEALRRVEELHAVARVLWPDRDDPGVLSELHVVLSELRHAEKELGVRHRELKTGTS